MTAPVRDSWKELSELTAQERAKPPEPLGRRHPGRPRLSSARVQAKALLTDTESQLLLELQGLLEKQCNCHVSQWMVFEVALRSLEQQLRLTAGGATGLPTTVKSWEGVTELLHMTHPPSKSVDWRELYDLESHVVASLFQLPGSRARPRSLVARRPCVLRLPQTAVEQLVRISRLLQSCLTYVSQGQVFGLSLYHFQQTEGRRLRALKVVEPKRKRRSWEALITRLE